MYKYTVVHPDNGISLNTGKALSSHRQICKNLKCILLSKRSQSEKAACYMIPTR